MGITIKFLDTKFLILQGIKRSKNIAQTKRNTEHTQ